MTTRTSFQAQTRPSLQKWNGGAKPGPGRPKGSATAGVVKGAQPTDKTKPVAKPKPAAKPASNPFGVKMAPQKSPFPGMKPVKGPKSK